MLELNDEDAVLLEDAGLEDIRLHLTQIKRQLWDEEHFSDNLCRKLSLLKPSERSSLASLLDESKIRRNHLTKLGIRLQTILDERTMGGSLQ